MKLYLFVKHIIGNVLRFLVVFLPVKKDKIVFDSYIGQGYEDNPEYIADEMLRQGLGLDMVWLVNDMDTVLPDGIRKARYGSVVAYYEMATAKAWVFDCRCVRHPIKKKNQIYLHTWHAPFTVKKIEKAAEDKLGKVYVKEAKNDGKIADGVISDGDAQTKQIIETFWLNENAEILKFGLPRNDCLIASLSNDEIRKSIRQKLGIGDDDVLIMYEPTFRNDRSTAGYEIELGRVRQAFEKLTGKNCIIGVRLHPNVRFQSDFFTYDEHVLNLTPYPDTQDLAIAGDYLITDYSTVVFDFSLLNKPVFICALDLDAYEQNRGLLKEFYEYPFPYARTNDELIECIEKFNAPEYSESVKKYFEINPIYDRGNASELTVEWIKNKMNI
jgi:CDP-glycerol glycerophosphotransferase